MKFTKSIFSTLAISTAIGTITNVYSEQELFSTPLEIQESPFISNISNAKIFSDTPSEIFSTTLTVQKPFLGEIEVFARSNQELFDYPLTVQESPFLPNSKTLMEVSGDNKLSHTIPLKDQFVTILPTIETKPIETKIILSENITTLKNALTGRPAHIQYILDNGVIGLQAYRDNVAPQYKPIPSTELQNREISKTSFIGLPNSTDHVVLKSQQFKGNKSVFNNFKRFLRKTWLNLKGHSY